MHDDLRGVPRLAVRLLPADVVERWYLPTWYELLSRHADGEASRRRTGAFGAAALLQIRAALALLDCVRLMAIDRTRPRASRVPATRAGRVSMRTNLRHARRAILRAPFVSILAIVAFALGLGVTTAVFTIFYSVLLKPLAYPDPDRLVMVYDTGPACVTCPASLPKYHDWKAQSQAFAVMGGSRISTFVLTGAGEPVQVSGAKATASLVDVFGVQPVLGRWFTEEEDRPNSRKVAVLSHGLWTSSFGRNPALLGQPITLDGDAYEVIGIMPAGFAHRRADLFLPLAMSVDSVSRGNHFLSTYARLKPGVTVEQAATEMRALGVRLGPEYRDSHGIDVRSYREVIVGAVRPQLRLLLGAVIAVLMIGSANVANLLLAAGLARRRELGIRLALGARVGDLARQLVTESAILAGIGGFAGVLLAFWILRVFLTLAGNQLPRASDIAIDGRMVLFAAAVTSTVAIVCGLWPLVRLRGADLTGALRHADTRTGSSGPRQVGNGLVVAEIALAFTLLVGAGLLAKNLFLLLSRDTGLTTDRVVTFDLAPGGARYATSEAVARLYEEVNGRIAQISGVAHVGSISHLPMYRFGFNGEMKREGEAPWGSAPAPYVEYRWYSGEYFQALGIALIKGRWLDNRDRQGALTALVNQQMAEKYWPGEDPIGKRFGQGTDRSRWWQVVGVVGNVRSLGLAEQAAYEFYQPLERNGLAAQTVVIRTTNDRPQVIVPSLKAIVNSIDPYLPINAVQSMDDVVSASAGQPRLISAMSAGFALLAALLAMVGVFGVMTYNVRRQRRELAIRLALGAEGRKLRRLVIARGLRLSVLGSAVGAVGAWLLVGTLRTMLNDVQPEDPSVFVATAVAVMVAALLASWLPARTAGRTDPMIVLREGSADA
jgi:putative ABC transport system permease protein